MFIELHRFAIVVVALGAAVVSTPLMLFRVDNKHTFVKAHENVTTEEEILLADHAFFVSVSCLEDVQRI